MKIGGAEMEIWGAQMKVRAVEAEGFTAPRQVCQRHPVVAGQDFRPVYPAREASG